MLGQDDEVDQRLWVATVLETQGNTSKQGQVLQAPDLACPPTTTLERGTGPGLQDPECSPR